MTAYSHSVVTLVLACTVLIQCDVTRDVTEPANIRIRRMRISCAVQNPSDSDADLLHDQNYQLLACYGCCNSTYLLTRKLCYRKDDRAMRAI